VAGLGNGDSDDISFIFFVLPPSESATNDEFVMLKKDAC
jgi:hypothetical protein